MPDEFPTDDALTMQDFERPLCAYTFTVDEGQRQMVIMALAKLAMAYPGWSMALEEICSQMDNKLPDGRPKMFVEFQEIWTRSLVAKMQATD